MDGPQDRSGRMRFDPWTVQAVASRYTDWEVQAHKDGHKKAGIISPTLSEKSDISLEVRKRIMGIYAKHIMPQIRHFFLKWVLFQLSRSVKF